MDQVRHLSRIVYTLFDLDAEPLVVAGIDRAGGYLPDKIHSLGRLETVEEPECTECIGMGGRYPVRTDRRLFHQSVHLPELPDPEFFAGEIVAGGRLSVREQVELRSARTEHAVIISVGTKHTAVLQLQVVSGLAGMGV